MWTGANRLKQLILPRWNGWYYFSTHQGTKYHFFAKGDYKSACGSISFEDRKNDKCIFTDMVQRRVCKHCLKKSAMFFLEHTLRHMENLHMLHDKPQIQKQARTNFSKRSQRLAEVINPRIIP